jgi:hypothetical protein
VTKLKGAEGIVKFLLTETAYFADEKPAIPSFWVKGELPLFLVLGDNAGGKSFFRRLVSECAKRAGIDECIHLSMQGRASGGVMRGMIYGSEDWQSTGEITGHTIRTGIKTCMGRDTDHLLYWDEPDLGLSEEATLGVALELEKFARALPKHTRGVFITTHSRVIARQLATLEPHYIHLGSKKPPMSLQAWLDRPIKPIAPEELAELSLKRFRAIQKILDRKKLDRSG